MGISYNRFEPNPTDVIGSLKVCVSYRARYRAVERHEAQELQRTVDLHTHHPHPSCYIRLNE